MRMTRVSRYLEMCINYDVACSNPQFACMYAHHVPQVVASFLEQVVSQTELEVTDVSVKVQHLQPERPNSEPNSEEKQTTLTINLPWLSYSDASEGESKQKSSVDNVCEKNPAMSAPHNFMGPKYQYHKVVTVYELLCATLVLL